MATKVVKKFELFYQVKDWLPVFSLRDTSATFFEIPILSLVHGLIGYTAVSPTQYSRATPSSSCGQYGEIWKLRSKKFPWALQLICCQNTSPLFRLSYIVGFHPILDLFFCNPGCSALLPAPSHMAPFGGGGGNLDASLRLGGMVLGIDGLQTWLAARWRLE